MCGIVCYNGKANAREIIMDGLERLEYRGYDSSGLAILKDGKISVYKEKGRLDRLKNEIKDMDLSANLGIGHIRWATHGEANKQNAHPHLSNNGKIAIVHNGIIAVSYTHLTLPTTPYV